MTNSSALMQTLTKKAQILERAGLPQDVSLFIGSHLLNLSYADAENLVGHFRIFQLPGEHAGLLFHEQHSCFFNSARNSKSGERNLLLVEGFATTVIPLMHAWNVSA